MSKRAPNEGGEGSIISNDNWSNFSAVACYGSHCFLLPGFITANNATAAPLQGQCSVQCASDLGENERCSLERRQEGELGKGFHGRACSVEGIALLLADGFGAVILRQLIRWAFARLSATECSFHNVVAPSSDVN